MILVTQASRISLCLALTRLGLREDMSLIKEMHSMHKIRMRASQTSTVSKVCQEQCLSSDLHTCLIVLPQTMNGLRSNWTGRSPPVLLHLRRREVAFRSPRNTSAGAYVKTDNDCCIRPTMKSGWRSKRLIASCRSLPFHRRIQTESPSFPDDSMLMMLESRIQAGQAFCESGPPCVSDRR